MPTLYRVRSGLVSLLVLLLAEGASIAQTIPPEVANNAAQWPLPNKDYASTRADFDSCIDSSNIADLAEAWTFSFPAFAFPDLAFFGKVATNPLVLDGIVYFQDLESNVFALNLSDGSPVWQTTHSAPNVGPNGVAVGYGKVFALKDPKTMAAFDLVTGIETWSVDHTRVPTEGITIQPLVYDDKLYMSTVPGTGIGTFYTPGATGMIHALDVANGSSLWSFDTVDTQPAHIWFYFGHPTIPDSCDEGPGGIPDGITDNSGGGAWYPPSVDTVAGTTYWGIGNPAPWAGTPNCNSGSSRPGPNLYSNSILALDHANGSLDWFHQAKPHDLTDADFMSTPILATTHIAGSPTDIAIGSGKLGKVFAYDRAAGTGIPLWTTSVGTHMNDEVDPLPAGDITVLPGVLGGVETPMAYAEDRVFVPVTNLSSSFNGAESGSPFGSTIIANGTGELVALNADDGSVAWSVDFPAINFGGATVVQDVVISATFDGMVYAHDRASGNLVWTYDTGELINSLPAVSGDTLLISTQTDLIALRLPANPIPNLVSQVSQANLQTHIDALATAIGPRFTAIDRGLAAEYIDGVLTGFGFSVSRDVIPSGENIVARRQGTSNPERIVLIGAHYDTVSMSPGADDNASGVAGVLEIARVLAASTFDATIEFVLFDLEEQGLVGSLQHAVAARAAGRDLDAVIILEMIGYTCANCETPLSFDPNACIEVSTQGLTTGLHVLNIGNHRSEALRQRFMTSAACFVPTLPTEWTKVACLGECAPDTRRSDHSMFWDQGYPAIVLSDGADYRNPNYHQATDTPATLDLAYARQVTQAALATAVSVADIEEIPVPSEPELCGSWQFTSECIDPGNPTEVIRASGSFVYLDTVVDGDSNAFVGAGTPTHFLKGIREVSASIPSEPVPVKVENSAYSAPPTGLAPPLDFFLERVDFLNPFALGDPSGVCDVPPLDRIDSELRADGSVTDTDGFWRATRIEATVTVGQSWLYDTTPAVCAYIADSPIECTTIGQRNEIRYVASPTTLEPRDGITVTFPPFSGPSTVLVTELTEPAAEVPANFELYPLSGRFFNIETTPPGIVPPVTVCFDYPDENPDDGIVDGTSILEGDLDLRHEENGFWSNVTTSRDPVANIICGDVNSLSQFVLGETHPSNWFFFGTAEGGTIDFTVEAVMLQVVTTAGQTAAQVAVAVATAINGDPTLSAAGVSATVSGSTVTTDGLVSATAINDPGLGHATVPALNVALIVLLGVLLVGTAYAFLRARRSRYA